MPDQGGAKPRAAFLGEVLDDLIERFGAEPHLEDIARARKEFDERRGRVFQDEDLWETYTQAFLEWYVVERPAPGEGRPPAARALALTTEPRRAAAIRAWLRSHRGLTEVRSLGGGRVELCDLIGSARFAVTEQRILHGVSPGDLVEVRLVGFEREVFFGRTFCYHPRGTREALVAHVRRLSEKGKGRAEILDYCSRLRIRCERYAHVAPQKIYETTTAELPAVEADAR